MNGKRGQRSAHVAPDTLVFRRHCGQKLHEGVNEYGTPRDLPALKRRLANQTRRDAIKRRRDVLQADAVQLLLEKYLPPA